MGEEAEPNPTGRRKEGVEAPRSEIPLVAHLAAVNWNDITQLLPLVDAIPSLRRTCGIGTHVKLNASNYFFVFDKYLAPGEQPIDENDTVARATQRARTGFVDAEVKAGRYTEADRQMWIDAWSQPGSTTAGLNDYRANHRNPPFNDRHPASTIPRSWSAAEMTKGAKSSTIHVSKLVIWGLKDGAILSGHLSGLDKWVPNLSVRLDPDDDHWIMMANGKAVARDVRGFITDLGFPKESVYCPAAK